MVSPPYYGGAAGLDNYFFYQLCLSMEHQERGSINAPSHREAIALVLTDVNARSLYSQQEPAMGGIQTQVLTVASPVLYHWTTSQSLLSLKHWVHSNI